MPPTDLHWRSGGMRMFDRMKEVTDKFRNYFSSPDYIHCLSLVFVF